MRKYKVFTSSIKPSLLAKLNTYSRKYNLPKNKIIEMALSRYLGSIKKAELTGTFKIAKRDKEIRSFSKTAAGDLITVFHRKK
jgi:Ribbon-helix-helix domain